MSKVIVRGVYSMSGFGTVTQGLLKLLVESGHDVIFAPIDEGSHQHKVGFSREQMKFMDSLIRQVPQDFVQEGTLIDVASLVVLPQIQVPAVKRRIFYSTYETIKIHKDYVNVMNSGKYDRIWGMSNYNKVSWTNSEVKTPIDVLMPYIDVNKWNPNAPPLKIKNKRSVSFIMNADVSTRKGLQLLIPAFKEEFKEDEDVCLILKLSKSVFGRQGGGEVIKYINEMMYKKKCNETKSAPVLVLLDSLSDELMSSFYTTGDIYVNPALAEGFGMPILESMACGLPQISTRISGHADLLARNFTYTVELDSKHEVIPINDEDQCRIDPRYRNHHVYYPSSTSLKEMMRKAFNEKELLKSKGILAREKAVDLMNIDRMKEKLNSLLESNVVEYIEV